MDNETLTAVITFMRHGEKDAEGALTTTGYDQAKLAGLTGISLNGDILLFHSGVTRVRDTIRTMAAHLGIDAPREESFVLGNHIIDYVAPQLHYLVDGRNKGTYHKTWEASEHSTKADTDRRMTNFLALGNSSPEEGIWYSARSMAQNIAIMIGIQVRFANMTDMSTRVNFVNGTHEPVLMSFLHYFMNRYAPEASNTVENLGGSIGFAEAFDILVFHKNPQNFRVELRFRDVVMEVDLVSLREFGYSL